MSIQFLDIKITLTFELVLTQPNQDKPFIFEINISEWAIDYTFFQTTDNKIHLRAYDGQKLDPAKINYLVYKKVLLVIKSAICRWNYYINNKKKTVVLTDHKTFKYLQIIKNSSKQLAGLVSEFAKYNLDIRYCKGKDAIIPNFYEPIT